MGKLKEFTVMDAVHEVLEEMPEDKKVRGYELCTAVRRKMFTRGTGLRPMDGTILRRVRDLKKLYHVTAPKGAGISEYVKHSPEEKWGA